MSRPNASVHPNVVDAERIMAALWEFCVSHGQPGSVGAITGPPARPRFDRTHDVRIVVDSDNAVAGRVLEIQHAAYAVEADIVGYDSIPPLHETLAELRSQPLIFLGVSCAGTLAGVLGYRRQGDTVDIDRLAVHPMFFRRGLATKLLRELLVRERDAGRFTVSTGFGNHAAVNLYERFDFLITGEAEPVPGAKIVLLQRAQQPTP